MPSTYKVTRAVLDFEEHYSPHTDERSWIANAGDGRHENGWRQAKASKGCYRVLPDFVKAAWALCSCSLLRLGREPNYEDLYFLASQIWEHLGDEYENPALEPLIERLNQDWGKTDIQDCARTTCRLIEAIVSGQLRKNAAPPSDHLSCLIEAIRADDVSCCDIFTLNHDLLIEKVLERAGLEYFDGFNQQVWQGNFAAAGATCLVKLHGSIDWWRKDFEIRKGTCPDYQWEPLFLAGTFNKIREYSRFPYADLLEAFRRRLGAVEHLIVSGYSFGDKGVNFALVEWLRRNPSTRMVVCAKGDAFATARGAIVKAQSSNAAQIRQVNSYLGGCAWSPSGTTPGRECVTPSIPL